MTVRQALDVHDRTISFREAEIFLQEALAQDRAWLHAHPEVELTPEQVIRYEHFIRRREANEPVAYIIGHKEFYGRKFKTDHRGLIPRPETEALIEAALDWIPNQFHFHLVQTNKPCPIRVLELGTGTGNIAVTLALESTVPVEILATDISREALKLAQENWDLLGNKENVAPTFITADLFTHQRIDLKRPYNLIIANLPYVPSTWQFHPDAQAEVVFEEPDIALFGGHDGLDIYRRFFQEVGHYIAEDGLILVEFNEDQTDQLVQLATHAFNHAKITVHKDYANLDRMLKITLNE